MNRRGFLTTIVFGAMIGVVLVLGFFEAGLWGILPFGFTYTRYVEAHLLRDTGYHVLLDACRELSQRADELGLERDRPYRVRFGSCKEAAGFPKPILELGPSYVYLSSEGHVSLEMLGGLGHCGVRAFPKDYVKPPFPNVRLGDVELIPGLWYYDDGYRNSSRHRERIDRLIEEGRSRKSGDGIIGTASAPRRRGGPADERSVRGVFGSPR
jgi:hypothetical protein